MHLRLLNKTLFVRLVLLSRPVSNTIDIFLINTKLILHHVLSIKYLWIYKILLLSIGLKSTEKNLTTLFNPDFFRIINNLFF